MTSNKVTLTSGRNSITLDMVAGTITGGTYPMQSIIKEEFPTAKWNGAAKAWTVEPDVMRTRVEKMEAYYTRVYRMEAAQESTPAQTAKTSKAIDYSKGPCPICGTYCYGDCKINKAR